MILLAAQEPLGGRAYFRLWLNHSRRKQSYDRLNQIDER